MKIFFLFLICISIILLSINFVILVDAQDLQDEILNTNEFNYKENKIYVSFQNNLAPSYEVLANSDEMYTLNQRHSWKRDETSRYNLVAYSLDNSDKIPIIRQPRGDFSLDIPMDSDHSIIFFAAIQYPLAVEGTTDFEFTPASPTGDDWFDLGSEITILAPYTVELEEGQIRQRLATLSIDKAGVNRITGKETEIFKTPEIHMSNMHTVDFSTILQYKIDVISKYGTTSGSGWYDAGSIATLSANSTNEFLVSNIIDGWEGSDVELFDNYAKVQVDSPKTLVVRWKTDYSQLFILVVIPIGAGIVFFVKKQNKKADTRKALEIQPPGISLVEKQSYDNYKPHDISNIILQKSIEELDSMHNSGLINDQRFSKIKEQLKNLYKS